MENRVNFVGVTTKSDVLVIRYIWNSLRVVFAFGVQFRVVINAESCMGWKPNKLEGFE